MGEKRFGRKAFWAKSVLGEKRFGRKAFWAKSVLGEKRFGRKAFWAKSVLGGKKAIWKKVLEKSSSEKTVFYEKMLRKSGRFKSLKNIFFRVKLFLQ